MMKDEDDQWIVCHQVKDGNAKYNLLISCTFVLESLNSRYIFVYIFNSFRIEEIAFQYVN